VSRKADAAGGDDEGPASARGKKEEEVDDASDMTPRKRD